MASKNKPKGKRKISKTASEDIENKNDAQTGEGEKPLLKRDAFICSTGHNAHLDEDYITDEMLLVGRKVRARKRSGDRRSVDTRSLRSISSQVTLSSYDMPPSLPSTLERKHLQIVAEEDDAHSIVNAVSQTTLTDDQLNANDPRLNYSAHSNYLPPQHRRMHSYGNQTPLDRPTAYVEDNYQRQSATSMPPLREGSDIYNALDQLYKANFEHKNLTRRLSSTSINSQRGIPAGVRLFPRQSIVHPVGPFDDPSLAQDEGGSYAEAIDPKTGRSRLIKRDSIIHPSAELNQVEEGDGTMLNRRGSVIRPLTLEQSDEPKARLFNRNSVTHTMQNAEGEEDWGKPSRNESARAAPSALGALISKVEAQKMIEKNAYKPTVSSLVDPKADRLYMPLFINNRFENPWPTWKKPGVFDAIQWKMTSKDNSGIPSEEKLNRTLPVKEPKFENSPPEKGIRVVWLGHATVLVRFDKLTVLTDPMFSERASPVGFMGPKRYRKAPCTVNDLPKVDVVLISHNHYDHLDLASVQMLNARFGAELTWFVPLGLQPWMTSVGCSNVVELSWWEKSGVNKFSDIEIVFTPAQHWCKRSPTDDNKVLWGSWCVLGPRHRFFFAGDTGYCDGFRQIGNKYGPFDLAAIPIGAYEPRWFMKYQHIDPDEAVMIHEDVKARQSIGIHWGTFALANEHYLEPPKKLHIALIRRNLLPHEFFTLNHGETKLVLREAELKRSTSGL